jgi:LuxR family transcriptional regulator, maltose regulon positive regulatory protein
MNGVPGSQELAMRSEGLDVSSTLGSRPLAELQSLRYEMRELADTLLHRGSDVASSDVQAARPVHVPDETPTAHATTTLYAAFFGTFAVFRNGARLQLSQNRSVGELCRYLIARNGEPVQRDEILDLLWPDAEPDRALHRLHVAVSGLRRVLDEPGAARSLVQLEDERYLVPAEAVTTDCELFEARYREGRALIARSEPARGAAALSAALTLYQGDYLSDQCYAEWTHPARAHFMERRLSALDLLAEHAADSGDLASLLEHAGQVLEIDGLRERAHRQLMRAHLALGQRACAMRQYQLCAELLDRELGVEPSRLTRQLYEAIRTDAELPPEVRLRD